MVIIITLTATLLASYFDILGIGALVHDTYLTILIYMLVVLGGSFPLVYIGNLLILLLKGDEISFGNEKSQLIGFSPKHRDLESDISEISIILPVYNNNKNLDLICYATLEKFDLRFNEDGYAINDDLTKKFVEHNLLKVDIPRLVWLNPEYQNESCEMIIPPLEKRSLEVARFRFILNQSVEANKPVGNIGIYYCKSKKNPLKQLPLGLYDVRISINYKKEGETILRKKIFDGYVFVSIYDDRSGWNFSEKDIRNRLKGKGIIDSGDPTKNNDIPKQKGKK